MKCAANFDVTAIAEPAPTGFALLKQMIDLYCERQQTSERPLPSLIDLSVGNPDVHPPAYWLKRLAHYINDASLHGYGEFRGDINLALREQFVAYHQRRFLGSAAVGLSAHHHVVDLQGSKEGIFLALLAFVKPGETLLLPDPSYSVYQACALQRGVRVEYFPCDASGQPDVRQITATQLRNARLLVLCSPNNPTGVVVTEQTLQRTVRFARQHHLKVVLDRAYVELDFRLPSGASQYLQGSALRLEGAMECVIELHSLSKSCGLAGWRIGFAVGAASMIDSLKGLKANSDFGMFLPFQRVATEMLEQLEPVASLISDDYRQRIGMVVDALNLMGWKVAPPEGGFFLWAKLPDRCTADCDVAFTQKLLNDTGILMTPGSLFGLAGKGYVRIALVQSPARLELMIERLRRWFISNGL